MKPLCLQLILYLYILGTFVSSSAADVKQRKKEKEGTSLVQIVRDESATLNGYDGNNGNDRISQKDTDLRSENYQNNSSERGQMLDNKNLTNDRMGLSSDSSENKPQLRNKRHKKVKQKTDHHHCHKRGKHHHGCHGHGKRPTGGKKPVHHPQHTHQYQHNHQHQHDHQHQHNHQHNHRPGPNNDPHDRPDYYPEDKRRGDGYNRHDDDDVRPDRSDRDRGPSWKIHERKTDEWSIGRKTDKQRTVEFKGVEPGNKLKA